MEGGGEGRGRGGRGKRLFWAFEGGAVTGQGGAEGPFSGRKRTKRKRNRKKLEGMERLCCT